MKIADLISFIEEHDSIGFFNNGKIEIFDCNFQLSGIAEPNLKDVKKILGY